MAIHLRTTKTVDQYGAEEYAVLCGNVRQIAMVDVTTMPRKVTCRLCRNRLKAMGIDTSFANNKRLKIRDGRIMGAMKPNNNEER